MRVGIFGGAFNPIHTGHLLLAETARDALKLDRVVFIPTGIPPHKPARALLPGSLRVRLIQLAIRDHPAFVASDVELKRDGPSYTIETVRLLRSQLPQATLFLLIGRDMLAVPWVAWKELKRRCTIVVVRRPGVRPLNFPAGGGVARGRPESFGSRSGLGPERSRGAERAKRVEGRRARLEKGLTWLEMPQVEIASSDIRRRAREGRSIRYLVPAAVERYIRHHRLYRDREVEG